jgi:acyl-CoA synthetase (NDP forming)
MDVSSIERLLAPKSIAIVGASDDPARVGGRPIQRMLAAGYPGPIYPVNPTRSEVQGLRAYPSVAAIDGPVDCAVLAVGADAVLPYVEQCAQKGVKSLVVFSAGFAETGAHGRAAQERMVELARAAGMRVIGPNCLGLYNVSEKIYLTFTSLFQQTTHPGRNVGVVSQSGGYASHVLKLAQNRGLAIGHFITTGNEADVEFGEALAALAVNPDVHVILAYIEGVRARETFLEALELAHRHRKPVVVLKVGKTEAGAAAAASHTAALTGADAIYNAVLSDYGAYRARSMEEALDVVYAASWGRFIARDSLCAITASGGIGVQVADAASEAGCPLRETPNAAQRAILEIVPLASARNPVDLIGTMMSDPHAVEQALRILLTQGRFDAVLIFIGINGLIAGLVEPFLALLARVTEAFPDKLLVVSAVAEPSTVRAFEAIGVPVFEDPGRAVKALAALARLAESFERGLPSRAGASAPVGEKLPAGKALNEAEGKAILARHGIGRPREILARDARSARDAAERIGYPVAVKILSPDIVHKTEVGGVALRLDCAGAVEAAVARMAGDIARRAPHARIDGYLVAEMVSDGVECILGVDNDPVFGPVVMFGLGGVLVELLKDVTFRLAPVDEEEARAMVASVRAFPLLDGYRGRPKADVDALATAIAAISRLAAANADRLRVLEVNPLLVMPHGRGVIALDAVIETGPIYVTTGALS